SSDLNLKDISSYQQIESLKTGEIDIGFGRFAHQDPWIQQILLRHERYMVALPKAHALAHIDEQRLIDLANNRLILYHQTHLTISTTTQHINTSISKSTNHISANDKSSSRHNQSSNEQPSLEPVTDPLLHLFAQYGISPF